MDKNTQLIYYLISKLQNQSNFSKSLLQQLFLIIDQISFLKVGKRISQFSKYKTFEWGIVPKPTEFFACIKYLEHNGIIKYYQKQSGGKTYDRYSISRTINIDLIATDELLLINEIVKESQDYTSRSVNEFYLSSHIVCRAINPEGWSLDFENTLLTLDTATASDIIWGKKIAN